MSQSIRGARILVVRSATTPDGDSDALCANGFDVTHDPYLAISVCDDDDAPARAHAILESLRIPGSWLICASAMAVRALTELAGSEAVSRGLTGAESMGARFAAVGPASEAAIRELGVGNVITPLRGHTASALLDALSCVPAGTAVLPRSDIADAVIPATLEARGWSLVPQVLYRTRPVEQPPASLAELRSGGFDAIVLRSPSAARAVRHFTGSLPKRTRIVCGGPTTAMAARRLGLTVTTTAIDSSSAGIVGAVIRAVDSVGLDPTNADGPVHAMRAHGLGSSWR
jgi:uroporphyrinogen-III synthase